MMAALASTAVLALHQTAPPECQPKVGVYRHQPQYHIIAPLVDRGNGTIPWPGGVNDANAVFERDGVFHVMHQCDGGGPAGLPCGGGHSGPGTKKGQTWWHTWGHLVSEDLVHWRRVADQVKGGLRPDHAGVRPLDVIWTKVFYSTNRGV